MIFLVPGTRKNPDWGSTSAVDPWRQVLVHLNPVNYWYLCRFDDLKQGRCLGLTPHFDLLHLLEWIGNRVPLRFKRTFNSEDVRKGNKARRFHNRFLCVGRYLCVERYTSVYFFFNQKFHHKMSWEHFH